jgi:hypothetical protein
VKEAFNLGRNSHENRRTSTKGNLNMYDVEATGEKEDPDNLATQIERVRIEGV